MLPQPDYCRAPDSEDEYIQASTAPEQLFSRRWKVEVPSCDEGGAKHKDENTNEQFEIQVYGQEIVAWYSIIGFVFDGAGEERDMQVPQDINVVLPYQA